MKSNSDKLIYWLFPAQPEGPQNVLQVNDPLHRLDSSGAEQQAVQILSLNDLLGIAVGLPLCAIPGLEVSSQFGGPPLKIIMESNFFFKYMLQVWVGKIYLVLCGDYSGSP